MAAESGSTSADPVSAERGFQDEACDKSPGEDRFERRASVDLDDVARATPSEPTDNNNLRCAGAGACDLSSGPILPGAGWRDGGLRGTNAILACVDFAGSSRRLGDLRPEEVLAIQRVVDQMPSGAELIVGGSAARSARRNVGREDLPFGKGPNMRSDIDYYVSDRDLKRVPAGLPGVDPAHGVMPMDSYLEWVVRSNPRIVFRPHQSPEFHEGK